MRREASEEKRFLKEIMLLNKHLPRKRKTLSELLREDKPFIVGQDGNRHRFRKDELKTLAATLNEQETASLKLPIYIELAPADFGRGTARISGKTACKLVMKTLDISEERLEHENELFIYRTDIRELRRKFPTTTQYMFSTRI